MDDERNVLEDCGVLITAIGNPNIDKTVKLQSRELIDKFNIPLNGHLPVADNQLKDIEKEIARYSTDISCTAGGCGQNTLKIFQWLTKTKFRSAMIGAIGCDQDGEHLQGYLRSSGIIPLYSRIKDSRTSCIYIFTYENNLSYAYDTSGAAGLYSFNHFSNDAALAVRNSRIVLFEAFFTMHSFEVSVHILETCKQSNVVTAFNICAEYVPIRYPNAVIPFVQHCDVVIGNKVEFVTLCQVMNIATDDFKRALIDVHKIMLSENSLEKFHLEAMNRHRKILLVTDGQEPVHCIYDPESKILEYRLSPINPTQIKDTTGAGDSFLAGVLYGLLEGFPIEKCLEIGHRTAIEIIKQTGCVVPSIDSSTVITNT